MGPSLLFLALLAALVSCEEPEGNGVRGAHRGWAPATYLQVSGGLVERVVLSPCSPGAGGAEPAQPFSALLPAVPGVLDTYWSGTAPICLGGCKGKHKELKRSQCGNGSCCWLGYKSFCRVNCGRPEADFNSVVYGNDWWVGSVVRYSCRPGFLLLGDPASACQSDGRWTPKPTCLREYRQLCAEPEGHRARGGAGSPSGQVGGLQARLQRLRLQRTAGTLWVGRRAAGGWPRAALRDGLQPCFCRDLPARPDRDQRAGHYREVLLVLQHPGSPGSLPQPRLCQDLRLCHQAVGLDPLVPALRRLRVRLPRAVR
ncbi:CUB and sushi domain-containing protein 1-like isoform X1 [Struthio camelus]|uniref:CUB and sushi domain-containing protein 1-like isoform X1 n=1 Tax=Struthio camelus TaxID=8801 RepID=UPI003603D746